MSLSNKDSLENVIPEDADWLEDSDEGIEKENKTIQAHEILVWLFLFVVLKSENTSCRIVK